MAVILLVDDERIILNLMTMVLQRSNHQALTASNGVEGLAVFRSYCELIDLVITDLKMPEMDGYELVARIRESRPLTKIVCMSGYLEEDCPKGVRFLRKPFLPDDLRACVEEVLDAERGAG